MLPLKPLFLHLSKLLVSHMTAEHPMTSTTYAITRLITIYYCSPAVMLHKTVRLPTILLAIILPSQDCEATYNTTYCNTA